MKQRKLNRRKGFTLVELLVVIAILAVLATVSVVGYTSFTKKAKVSNDTALVSQLNTLLKADETIDGKAKTPSDALKVTEESGYNVTKLTPTTDKYDIVWNQEENQFALLDEKDNVVYGTLSSKSYNNWKFSNEYDAASNFSIYLKGNETIDSLNISTGLDVGNNTIKTINYTNTSGNEKDVLIRTDSNDTVLNIDGVTDEITHYGEAKEVNVIRVKMGTYIEYGNIVGNISLAQGKVEMKTGASATNLIIRELTNSNNETIMPKQNNVSIDINESTALSTIQSEINDIIISDVTSGNGIKDVAVISKDDTNVAYVGSTGYKTLKDAVNSLTASKTIILVKDAKELESIIVNNYDCTIDLNGHNLSSELDPMIYVLNHKNLVISNSQDNNGTITSTKTIVQINDGGSIVIGENVTLKVNDTTKLQPTVLILNGSKLDVYGKIYNEKSSAIQGNGQDNTAQRSTKINIYKNAFIKSDSLAIYHPQLGILNIDGATIEGYCGIGIKSGTINIVNNAIVRGVANDNVLGDEHSKTNGINYDGSAIVLDTYVGYAGNMNVTIKDSTIESLYSYAIKEIKSSSASNSNVVSLSIDGESVVKSANEKSTTGDIYLKEASSVKISSGTFSKEVYASYIENGRTVEKNGNVWIVK